MGIAGLMGREGGALRTSSQGPPEEFRLAPEHKLDCLLQI